MLYDILSWDVCCAVWHQFVKDARWEQGYRIFHIAMCVRNTHRYVGSMLMMFMKRSCTGAKCVYTTNTTLHFLSRTHKFTPEGDTCLSGKLKPYWSKSAIISHGPHMWSCIENSRNITEAA